MIVRAFWQEVVSGDRVVYVPLLALVQHRANKRTTSSDNVGGEISIGVLAVNIAALIAKIPHLNLYDVT